MSPKAPGFGCAKPKDFFAVLHRRYGYEIKRVNGSHHHLRAPGMPPVLIAVHSKELGPALVRDTLVKQVGLTIQEAREVAREL